MRQGAVRWIPNGAIEPLLLHDPLTHVFPLHVCRHAPGGEALVLERGGRTRAVVIDGGRSGCAFVQGAWMLAHDPRDAFWLLEALAERGPRPALDFPPSAAEAFRQLFPGVEVGHEFLHRFDRPRPVPVRDVRCGELAPGALGGLRIPEDVARALGDLTTLPDRGLFGAVEDGRLVAIADVFVDVGPVVAVQQVLTTADRRGAGVGRVLLSHVCRVVRERGQDLTYVANEANHASNRLAASVGFERLARFAWAPPA